MPQIGWLEILAVVIIAILVLGPKEFPIALKKIGSYIGKLKNTFSSFQREISSVTSEIDSDKATLTISAEDSGAIKILKESEITIAVGEVICTIDTSNLILICINHLWNLQTTNLHTHSVIQQ